LNKIARLRQHILEQKLDAVIITKPTNRRYLSGFTGSNGYLLMTTQENILLTDFRYTEQASKEAPDFKVIQYQLPLTNTLRELTATHKLSRIGLERETITLGIYEEFTAGIPDVKLVPITDPVDHLRRVKLPHELDCIKKAAEITDKAFLHILDFIRTGMTENEVAVELEFFMKRLGSERNAFEIIVASGVRGALPHGVASSKIVNKGEMVTLDLGCVYQGYHSDMTRTIFLGKPEPVQREIYELVLRAQEAVLQAIQPGMTGMQADTIARNIISKAGYGDYFGHGLGHSVGLDIHEEPRLAPHDASILEPGMVVTVEPGVYLPNWGGVRIEDLIVITSDGCDIISKSPKELLIVENY